MMEWNWKSYLSFRWINQSPVVGSELVKLIKLEADVLNWQLEHIPETRKVRGYGMRVRIGVLQEGESHKDFKFKHNFLNNNCRAEMYSKDCLENTQQ